MSDTRTEETTDDRAADAPEVIAGSEESRPKHRSAAAPALGFLGGLRFIWTQLTTMRTALGLLFLLALAAIPGSLVPQESISPVQVNLFLDQHKTLGPIYDKVGLFNVYTSPWFSAIYLLLFISLIGCIIPRVAVYLRALRARPPRTPRYLHRMPAYVSADLPGADDAVIGRVAAGLKRRRYRVVRHADGSVSAERGYLREAGNLLFHISLVFVLVGVAVVWLTNFRGTSSVVVGNGFANNLAQYDDFKAGPLFNEKSLTPFSIKVNSFDVKFETGAVQRGAAREFKANVTVTDAPGQKPHNATIQVNHPLHINGSTVHLVAWGYAPVVTVKDGNGNVAYSGPVIFLPQDGNFTSAGAIKAPDARPERFGFEGLFLPSAVIDNTGPHSVFPGLYNPQLFLNAWSGRPGPETGVPESVYTLDKTGMTQIMDPKKPGQPLRFILRPGYVQKLPGGGSIQLDGVQRWIKLQVGDSPGVYIAIVAIGCAVLGLCFSLFIRPRRVWARLRTTKGSTVFEIAGLDRADARTGLQEDLADLLDDVVRNKGLRTEETT
ncbi:cytochrome c biogenesis protein ResB [Microlunatus sp. Gsoil 973]|uniref:cytochrome c biogenesis protein ResB n=1 Tax=Microlunatus sp. Gsoil 973 TaxID=2672569 RepID=UPI0012B4B589|nr:cytochrome c biogenesis protein ResB [Microlunatus sp. Gsoil 973]QGN33803.1 cytochrome c biogenesis protein ResB [Microlunatus sp. Gsoil 973]